jgi:hypothetical protein
LKSNDVVAKERPHLGLSLAGVAADDDIVEHDAGSPADLEDELEEPGLAAVPRVGLSLARY